VIDVNDEGLAQTPSANALPLFRLASTESAEPATKTRRRRLLGPMSFA